ncbi:MAG: tautomerase family protein [Methanobacterium sp.]|nr:tautomerase family protein [Methanobacterium sp.]
MPLVRIEICQGKSAEYKKAILDGVHQALVSSLGIPDTDRFQRLYELPLSNYELPPDRSDDVTIIEITIFKGRTSKTKKALYQAIVENLNENPGITGYDVLIILLEPPLENWGVRGGKPASEIDFDFKIDV